MDFFEAVKRRHSVRLFTGEPIDPQFIDLAVEQALLAPNSSNLQPWEFYHVVSSDKKAQLVKACLSQLAASTASDLVVTVARIDTWKRNRNLLLVELERLGFLSEYRKKYYSKIIPLSYQQDPLGLLALFKWMSVSFLGLFKATPRGPFTKRQLFQVVHKTTALACENLMLALAAQNLDSCPMEGFDHKRVKKIMGLGSGSEVTMVIAIGKEKIDPQKGKTRDQVRVRLDSKLFYFKI